MNIIARYIHSQLTISTALISFVLVGILWLFVSVKALESILNKGMTIQLFATLTLLQVPNLLPQILPFAAFIAVLYIYSRLNSDREIAVLRSAGISPLELSKPAIVLGLWVTAIVYSLTIFGAPFTYKKFRNLQWDVRYSVANIIIKEGTFNSFSKGITVYVRERGDEKELKGLLVHDARNPLKPITYHADSGTLVENVNSAKVVLLKGSSILIDKKNPQVNRTIFFDKHVLSLSEIADKPVLRYREPRERSIYELFDLKVSDIGNPKDFGKFKVEMHSRLSQPLATLAFCLIALVSLLSGDFSREGQLKRIIFATICFICLTAFNLTFINLCAKHPSLIPVLYSSNCLSILICSIILVTGHGTKLFPFLKKREGHN